MASHHYRTNSSDLAAAYRAAGRYREADTIELIASGSSQVDDAWEIPLQLREPDVASTSMLAARTRGRVRAGEVKLPMPPLASAMPGEYKQLIQSLKSRIESARIKASDAPHQELLLLYYSIGFDLDCRLQEETWGTAIIDWASGDLRAAFPQMRGLSPRNLRCMRAFYQAYRPQLGPREIWRQTAAKLVPSEWHPAITRLPWGHHVLLIEKIKDQALRVWYAAAAVEYSWSRPALNRHIDGRFHDQRGKAITKFRKTASESTALPRSRRDARSIPVWVLVTDAPPLRNGISNGDSSRMFVSCCWSRVTDSRAWTVRFTFACTTRTTIWICSSITRSVTTSS